MTHLAAGTFFILSLLAALVGLHLIVRASWTEIATALRGELGREVRPRRPAQAPLFARRRAAF